jgi:CSLREA domain-containing protein
MTPRLPFRHVLLAALLLLASLPLAAATFQVNDTGDAPDNNIGNGICATAGGVCTLRAAIQEANALAASAPHRITFASNVASITLTQTLPPVNVPIEIDGNRADPLNPRVDIDGNGVSSGFQFADSASLGYDPSPGAPQSGLFNLVVRNVGGDGVSLSGRGFTVQNCYIGMMPDGQAASANTGHGISISSPAPAVPLPDLPDLGALDLGDIEAVVAFLYTALAAINAPTVIQGNLISGNGLDGVHIFGQHTAMVFVRGNRIGIDADGDTAVPNGAIGQGNGVQVISSAFANFIGPFNLISGNNRTNSAANGVYINNGAVRFPNFIAGNLIGPGGSIDPFNFDPFNPNIDDVLDFGNLENGIRLDTRRQTNAPANPTPYSVIIGPANVISFNGSTTPGLDLPNADPNAGVFITANSADAYLLGNFIGGLRFEIMGNPQLLGGNKGDGVQVTTSNHRIGGPSLAERNVISGNGRHGITIRNSGTRNVTVQGNLLGRDLLDLLDFGNGGDGIYINAASVLTIGGSADGAGNVIAASVRNGVKITNGSPTQGWANLVSRNRIFGNGTGGTGLGIDLDRAANAPDPVDSNGPVPTNFANMSQNAPVVCGQPGAPAACSGQTGPTYAIGSGQLALNFALSSSQPNADYLAEVFLVDAPGNGGNGEGRVFVGEMPFQTDAAGNALVPLSLLAPPGGATGMQVTVTVTDVRTVLRPDGSNGPANNTSEFSAAVAVVTPGVLAFTPATLPFGAVDVGATTDLQTTLSHVDGDTVTGITLGVSGAGFTVQASTCGAEPFDLAAGASCDVTVRFAPAMSGAAAGTLTAAATVGNDADAALSGTGQVPGSLAFADAALDLGAVVVGANATATTTLSNPGQGTVGNVLVAVTGSGFSRDGGSCGVGAFALAGGASCTVTVRFEPMAGGAAAGTLSADGDGAGDSVALSATGLAAATLVLDQSDYDFGTVVVGMASDRTATLANSGGVDATNVQVLVSGGSFTRTGGSCGAGAFTLPAASSCTVEMQFLPVAAGAAAGDIAASADGGLSDSATLGGNALAAGALEFDPAALPFGSVVVGASSTLATTLRNTGGAAIDDIELMVSGGGFSRDGGSCPAASFALGAGAECTVVVRFTPVAAGAANGDLVASSPQGGAAAALTGTGLAAAALEFGLPSYGFGSVEVGSFLDQTATLSNTGGVAATNIALTVSGSGFSRINGSCPANPFDLAAGASCTVELRFAPAAPGAASGSLGALGDDGANAAAGLDGTGVAPASLGFDLPAYDFGTVVLGMGSDRVATLANSGGVDATGVQLAVTGSGYTRTGGSCGIAAFTLAAGATCTVELRFEPAVAGAAAGNLAASADGGLSAGAGLTGMALEAGALEFTPALLAFGDLAVGADASLSTTLANTGGTTIDDIGLSISGAGFALIGGSCPGGAFSLAAGATCTVEVRFQPAAGGAANGSLVALAPLGAAAAMLSGNGLAAPALAFDLPDYAFGAVAVGGFADRTATLSNPGNAAAEDVQLAVAGSGFSRIGGDCPAAAFTLPAAGTCTVVLRFAPAAPGAASGNIDANATGGTTAVATLSGEGLAGGSLAFTPPALDFGSVAVGSDALLLTTLGNTGGVAVDDIVLSVSGAGMARDGGSCPAGSFTLAAGADCTVAIRFTPAAAGAVNGSLLAASPAGNASAALGGIGTVGVGIAGFLPVGGLDFGAVAVGGNATLSITLANSGTGPLTGLLLAVEGPFTITANACPATLAAGASCTLSIRFAPAAIGAAIGLVRATADGGIDSTAPLAGNGIAAPVATAPHLIPTLDRLGLLLLVAVFGLVAVMRLRASG